ncbi:MAG TPA: hypothetical protein VMT57_08575 [Candidatus Thermoplasmatota archaeon]|nr:hypothetical protein [Candidatus Thermoplasmatota archaeon]
MQGNSLLKKGLTVSIILLFVGTCLGTTIAQNTNNKTFPNNNTWWRTYGGPYWDSGFCLKHTTDGGYIIAGESAFRDSGNTGGRVIKTNAEGILTWEKLYGEQSPSTENFNSVCQTSDGGYIFAGYTMPNNYQFAWLVKTDASGNEIWNKSYQFGEFSIAFSVVQTFDEGFLVAGEKYYFYPNMNSSALLVKVDKEGNQVWNKTYGGYLTNEFRQIRNTADGGFIVAGVLYNQSSQYSYPWLLKVDEYGEEQWNDTYILTKEGWNVYDVLQTNDGGYTMIGDKIDFFHVGRTGWMMKTDKDGNEEWMRTYQRLLMDDTPYSFSLTSDGGYIVTGQEINLFNVLKYLVKGKFRIDLWLAKIDEIGTIKWSKIFNKRSINISLIDTFGTSALQIGDGGYVILGNSNSEGLDDNDFDIWLIKTNRFGLSAKTRTVQAVESENDKMLRECSIACPFLKSIHDSGYFRRDWYPTEVYDNG